MNNYPARNRPSLPKTKLSMVSPESSRNLPEKGRSKRGWLLICAFTLMADSIFPSGALAAVCGEPGTCIVLVRLIGPDGFCRKPPQGGLSGYGLTDISGYDYSCEYLQTIYAGTISNCFYPQGMYQVYYYKLFWDKAAAGWRLLSSANSYYTIGDSSHTPPPPVPGEIVFYDNVNFSKLPKGCSDLPSQQPTLSPSPDTGKPECANGASLE